MKWIVAWVMFFISSLLSAEEVPSRVRVSLNPGTEAWVGQRVPLVVELLAPGYFSDAPVFDLPRVPGILILPPDGSPTVGSEETEGVNYTVQRHELMVFSRKPGAITIPSFEVRFGIKRQPLDHESVPQSVKTPAVSFTAKSPPGSRPDENLVTSRDLAVSETWKPEPGSQAKAGDAFVRMITWTASDVPGMAFPPFEAGIIQGLGIYQGEPVVNDTSERGELHGGRTDKVTYVCKTGGHFVIPALTLRWWDPGEKEMKQVVFPPRTFDVPEPPVPPVPFAVRATRLFRDRWLEISVILPGLAVFLLAIRRAWDSILVFVRRLLPRQLTPLNPS